MVGNEIGICEVIQEQPSAAENLHPKCVAEWTTGVPGTLSSSLKMPSKAVENWLDRRVESDADAARPVSQMLSRSDMSASGELRVPILT
jgi:hypothetical protein